MYVEVAVFTKCLWLAEFANPLVKESIDMNDDAILFEELLELICNKPSVSIIDEQMVDTAYFIGQLHAFYVRFRSKKD
jgi:hypothetical protein